MPLRLVLKDAFSPYSEAKECKDKAKWCPCMADDCHKSKVEKKCPLTCGVCTANDSATSTATADNNQG